MAAAFGRRRTAIASAAAAVLLLGLTGCGSDSSALAGTARDTLHQDVARIRAASDDPAAAGAALTQFRTHVNDLVAAQELDATDALRLIAHAGLLETALPTPTAAPTTVVKKVTAADDQRVRDALQRSLEQAWKAGSKGKIEKKRPEKEKGHGR